MVNYFIFFNIGVERIESDVDRIYWGVEEGRVEICLYFIIYRYLGYYGCIMIIFWNGIDLLLVWVKEVCIIKIMIIGYWL